MTIYLSKLQTPLYVLNALVLVLVIIACPILIPLDTESPIIRTTPVRLPGGRTSLVNNAQNIDPASETLTIRFNENIRRVEAGRITLRGTVRTATLGSNDSSQIFNVNNPSQVTIVGANLTLLEVDLALQSSYQLVIPAGVIEDTAGNGIAETILNFTTGITDPQNEAPRFDSASYTFSAAENISDTVTIGTVSASDPNNDALIYSITSPENTIFEFADPQSGALSLVDGQSLDFETLPNSYTLSVQADDARGLTATTQVSITVTNVNEVSINDDHGDSQQSSTEIMAGTPLSGSIDNSRDQDWFRINISQSGTLIVRTISSINTEGALYNEAGIELQSDDDSGTGNIRFGDNTTTLGNIEHKRGVIDDFHISQSISPGTYYIRVTGSHVFVTTPPSDPVGNYSIRADFYAQSALEPQPDLLVRDFSKQWRYSFVGQNFMVNAHAHNAGNATFTGSGTVRFYQSTDPTIDPSDTEIGTAVNISNLPASANSAVFETTITAPLVAGTYYYGACFDPVEGEVSIVNNCTPSLPRTIIDLSDPVTTNAIAYDLRFGEPRTVPNVIQGESLFKVEVLEAGRLSVRIVSITGILLVLYNDSSSHTLTSNVVGSRINNSIEYEVTPGTYYVLGVDWRGHGFEEFTVQADFIPLPDLTVQDPGVASIPTNLPGEDLTLIVQVHNTGGANASASTVNFYRSNDPVISSADLLVGTGAVSALAAGETSASIEFETTTPTSTGTYYYGACVESLENELDTSNNCSSAIEIRVIEPSDDHGNSSVHATAMMLGAPVSGVIERASDQDWFSINIPSGGGDLTIYTTGTSNTIGTLHDSNVRMLVRSSKGGAEDNFRISHRVAAGTHFIQVLPAPFSSGAYQLHAELANLPDLVVQSPTVSDNSLFDSRSINISAQVRNAGTANSVVSVLRFYQSSDPVISGADVQIGTRAVGALSAGEATDSIRIDTTTPLTPGTYYYGACVDSPAGESDTSNNCSSAVMREVGLSDIHGNSHEEATGIMSGIPVRGFFHAEGDQDWFRIQTTGEGLLTVYTKGTTDTRGMLYNASTPSVRDRRSTGGDGGNFRIGRNVNRGIHTYFIQVTPENATSLGEYQLHAEFSNGSDLILQNLMLSHTSISPGDSLSISVVAHNAGMDNADASTVRFFRSSNSGIRLDNTQVGTAVATSVLSGGASSGVLSSGNIDTSTPGIYYFGACIVIVGNETNTYNNCTRGMRVTIGNGDDYGDSSENAHSLTLGSPTNGSIEEIGDEDWFSITLAEAGEVDIYTQGGTDTYGILYDSDGYSLYESRGGGIFANFRINLHLSAGTYYIRVNEYNNNAIGNYTIRADFSARSLSSPSSDRANARGLVVGGSLSASITAAGDQQWYSIVPSETGWLTLYSEGALDTQAVLFGGSAQFLQENDDGASDNGTSGSNFLIRQSVSAGSTYYLRVNEFGNNGAGDYSVRVLFSRSVTTVPTSDHGDTSTNATAIAPGGSASGSINPVGDADWFSITATGAGTLVLYSLGDTDMEAALFDSSDATTALHTDDDDGPDSNFFIMESLSSAGTYYLRVNESRNNETGDYSIHTHFIPTTVTPSERPDLVIQNLSVLPTSVMLGQSITLSFQVYNAGPGEAEASTVGMYRSSNPSISMTDTLIASEKSTSALASGASIDFTETVTLSSNALGSYYYGACVASVSSETSGANNCSPGVAVLLNDDHSNTRTGATAITAGTPQSGRIDNVGDRDWFSIHIPSGGGDLTVYTTGITDTSGELYRNTAFLSQVARESSGGSGNNFRISEGVVAGEHLIRVTGSAVGNYELHAEFSPSSDLQLLRPRLSATRVLQGEALSMSVEVRNIGMGNAEASTVRFYRSNDNIIDPRNDTEIAMVATNPLSGGENGGVISSGNIDTSALALGVYYFGACIDSVDNEIDSSDNCAPVISRIPVTIVRPDDHGNSRANASTLTLGSPTNGVIEERGDEDWFSITLAEAGEVNIYTTGSTDTYGMLYDSDGYLLYEDNNSGSDGNFRIDIRLAMGEYYIRVNEYGDNATGNYTIQADFSARSLSSPSSDRANARGLVVGGSLSASITAEGDQQWYSIAPSETGWLTIYAEGALDTEASLFDASAQFLQENDDGASSSGRRGSNFLIRESVSAGSTYYLRVNEFGNNATGSYSLRVLFSSSPTTEATSDQGDTSATATAIAPGGSTNGSIDPVGDADWFSITTTGAGTLVVYSLGITDVEAALFASSDVTNALHEDDDDGPRRNFFIMESLSSAGTYYLSVSGRRNRTGDYSIHTHFIPD